METLKIFSVFFAFTAAGYAAGAPSPYVCMPPSELSAVKDCSQNLYFTKAARGCLAKLESDIEAKKSELSLLMAASSIAAGSAQAARMQNNIQNLQNLVSTIDGLTSQATKAREEIVSYTESFVFAGPMSRAMAEKLHMVRYLTMFDCYSVPRSEIGKVVRKLDEHISEFRKLNTNARALDSKTSVAVKRVDSSSVNAPVSNRAPASAGAPVYAAPPPKAKQGPSDISGTDKIGESNRALQKLTK